MENDKFVVLEGDDLPFKSNQAISVLLESILKGAEPSSFVEQLNNFIKARASHEVLYGDVINILQEWCTTQIEKNSEYSTQARRLLDRLKIHQVESERVRSVYSKDNKINPSSVYWPDPTLEGRPHSIFDEEVFARSIPLLDKTTPIGSAGSCFASEIAERLQADGFNYIISENYKHPHQRGPYPPASAAYGAIFNSRCFTQLIEKAFRVRELPKLIAKIVLNGETKYCDPFREAFFFKSEEEIEANYESHREACRKAFEECKVFCLTVGINEVWMLKGYDVAIPRYPAGIYASLLEYKVLSVDDNINNLQRMLDVWRAHNPDIKLIISVSPIPLTATFRADDQHVISASAHSKATLRVAVEEFVKRNEGVFYFPAYETVMHTVKDPWEKDQRHVTKSAIEKVMKLFMKTFVK